MIRQIAHLDMDAFFVSVECALNPALRGKPVIVGGQPTSRGVVAAASYEARKFGVHSAMPLAEARRRCPRAVFVAGDFERYIEASAAIDRLVRQYAPAVEWVSIDEAYLDLTGSRRAVGAPLMAVERLQQAIKSTLNLDASAGLASNKLVAKISSALAKPRGLLCVLPGYEGRFLAPLGIEVLPGVGPATAKLLHGLGIRTLGELAAAEPTRLEEALGGAAAGLARRARGEDHSPVEAEGGPRSISKETTLARDTADADYLRGVLHYLLERAARKLRAERLRTRTITVKVRFADFTTVSRATTLRESSDLDADLLPPARDLLTALLKPGRRVRLVGVSLSGLRDQVWQPNLFDRGRQERLSRLYRGVDEVRERYGFDSLFSGNAARGRGREIA